MIEKEATARIKINKLLDAAGWLFFPEGGAPANIRLEPSVTIKSTDLDALGDDLEKTGKGFVDSCSSTPRASRSSSLKPRPRARTPLSEKSRLNLPLESVPHSRVTN